MIVNYWADDTANGALFVLLCLVGQRRFSLSSCEFGINGTSIPTLLNKADFDV
jgi:hypothetical protein